MDTDILVVGAGPTGLMLANQLARRGVRASIIDHHSGPARQTRAMGVHARTLEIYSSLGIAGRALELGRRGEGANMWANGRRMARIPVGDIGRSLSPFPFILMLGQDDNERILGDRLRDLGMDVQWNTGLTGLDRYPDHVRATLTLPSGEQRHVSTAWVAGCDGSRSTVRELCGITFPGAPYEHMFFVADTRATGDMVPEELNVYLWNRGFHLFFPMYGEHRWRVIGILPPVLQGRNNLSFDDVMPHVRAEAGTALTFSTCSWFSTYRIHHRSATRFRDGRCFLLGDAAHVHSPMGAQGMNTGLQDAYNLAWKLALVINGRADARLLDSYEQERLPIARRLLHTTDRAFMLVVRDNWLARLFRTQILARVAATAMRFERIRRFAFMTLSQIGIHYRGSALSQTLPGLPANAPHSGDRFPWMKLSLRDGAPPEDLYAALDDTRFNLLLFGQSLPEGAPLPVADLMNVHRIPADPANHRELDRVRVPVPSFYLLRPDGHVGLAGLRVDAESIARYLKGIYINSNHSDKS
jgi:2-polyprenyl-6-methoxyphenol hydroxylase-like FAD-dependent oxidoreductase